MPEINLSAELYTRISEFKRVVEAVIDEEIDIETCANLIISQGIDAMLASLLSPLNLDTLLGSIQQLGSQYPAQVYEYLAKTISQGADVLAKEEMKKRMGYPIS